MKAFLALILASTLTFVPPTVLGSSNFVRNRQNFVIKQKVVDIGQAVRVVGVPVTDLGVKSYYEVNGQAVLSDEDVNRIANAVVELLLKRLGDNGELPADPETPPTDDGTTSLQSKVTDIITTNCAKCHTGNKAKGGVVLITDEGKLNSELSREQKWDIYDAVFSGRMPKNTDKPLDDETVQVFLEWARIK